MSDRDSTVTSQGLTKERIIDILEEYEGGGYLPHPDANAEDAFPAVADAIMALIEKCDDPNCDRRAAYKRCAFHQPASIV